MSSPRSRIRRLLFVLGYLLGALVVVFAIALIVLRVTNPAVRKTSSWGRLAEMPEQRGETASAGAGNRMIVAGGLYGVGRTADSVYVYDMARNEWTRGRSLPAPRHHAAAAAIGDHVYVSGGSPGATDWKPTDTLWRAKPGEAWRSLRSMPEGRQGHAMVALNGRLYVVGGVGASDRTLIYDPARDVWTTGAALPSGLDHLRAVAWRGEVWAIGGRDRAPTRRVDIYNPATDGWRSGPDLPGPMSAMAVGVLGDGLHVAGGEDPGLVGGRVIDEHYVLAQNGRRWVAADRLMLPVHGAGYAVLNGRLIVAGGAAREGLLSTIAWTAVTQRYRPPGINVARIQS
jgi:hypothetical protein